jgi:hypothetical protein
LDEHRYQDRGAGIIDTCPPSASEPSARRHSIERCHDVLTLRLL